MEKAAQIPTAVEAQGWYSQPLPAFLLMGGNLCGKDVSTAAQGNMLQGS